jgi:hypothetical protein
MLISLLLSFLLGQRVMTVLLAGLAMMQVNILLLARLLSVCA